MKERWKKTGVITACVAGMVLCVTSACRNLSTETTQPVTLEDGRVVNAPQQTLKPDVAALTETTGQLFGPVGDAAAKCGLAIAALVLAESNRRKLNKHLAQATPRK